MATEIFSFVGLMGSGISAFGQWQAGKAQKEAADYNIGITRREMGEEEATTAQKYDRLMGRQKVLYGKAGVSLTSGSPLLTLVETEMAKFEDIERIKESGESKIAQMRFAGEMAEWSGTSGAFSTFLTGAGKAGLAYLRPKYPGSYARNPWGSAGYLTEY